MDALLHAAQPQEYHYRERRERRVHNNKPASARSAFSVVSFLACGALLLLFLAFPARAAEPVPGDACTAAGATMASAEGGSGHFMICESGTWKSVYSYNETGALTKLGNQACASGQVLKFNGTIWACAADDTGLTALPSLNAARIWVGNASNTAAAVAMSGDAALSNAGVLSIGNSKITSAHILNNTILTEDIATGAVTNVEIADNTIQAADIAANAVDSSEIAPGAVDLVHLSATGTKNNATFLRGDNTWAAPPAGEGTSAQTTVTCTAANNGATCTTAACPSGYIRSGCSAYSAEPGQPNHARPNSSNKCQCRQGASGGGTLTCYTYCVK